MAVSSLIHRRPDRAKGCVGSDDGLSTYRDLLDSVRADLTAIGGETIMLTNTRPLYQVLEKFVFDNLMASARVVESMAKAAFGNRRLVS